MTDSGREILVVVGVLLMGTAIRGACDMPRLWELCNTGELSGPRFLGLIAVIVTLFAVGLRLYLGPRKRHRDAL